MGRKNHKSFAERFESPIKNDRFARFHETLLTSSAYKSLSHSARTVYTIIKLQYKGNYTGDTVTCPYSVFNEYGMNNKTVSRAISELEEKGFLKRTHGPMVTRNLKRAPNKYTFLSDWIDWKP